MKKAVLLAVSGAILATAFVSAQFGPPDPKVLKKYAPWFDLMYTVDAMARVDRQPGLAFTAKQAGAGLPILDDLGNRADLKLEEATKINKLLEDKVASDAQVKWIAKDRERLEAERKKKGGNEPPVGLSRPDGPPNPAVFGMIQAMNGGKPYNPFKGGPAEGDLKALRAILEKR